MGFFKRALGGKEPADPGPDWARPMSRDETTAFLDAVGRELERLGLPFSIGDGVVHIERGGRSSDYGLTNLAQVCHGLARHEWAATVAGHFQSMLAAEDAQAQLDERARDFDAIRSIFKVRFFPDARLGGIYPERPASWQVAPGLVASFVYDLPTTVASVSAAHIEGWGQGHDALLAVALENIRHDSVEGRRIADEGPSSAIACVADHFFVASHAFLLGERVPAEAKHGAVFSVPHRHALLYAPILDIGIVQSINRLIVIAGSLFNQGPGSISPSLYWWRNGSVSLLPAEVDEHRVQFAPPDDFVQVLNGLAER